MKKIIFIFSFLLISSFISTTTFAQSDHFYEERNKNWIVLGVEKRGKLNPVCSANYVWRDGSEFRFFKDLVDGEVYMLLINNQWNIVDDVNKIYKMRIVFYYGSRTDSSIIEYELISNNTIRMRNLNSTFIQLFEESHKMNFIMPGDISNATISLNGSRQALDMMVECMNQFKPM